MRQSPTRYFQKLPSLVTIRRFTDRARIWQRFDSCELRQERGDPFDRRLHAGQASRLPHADDGSRAFFFRDKLVGNGSRESTRACHVAGVFEPQAIRSMAPIAQANQRNAHSLVDVLACTSGLLSCMALRDR